MTRRRISLGAVLGLAALVLLLTSGPATAQLTGSTTTVTTPRGTTFTTRTPTATTYTPTPNAPTYYQAPAAPTYSYYSPGYPWGSVSPTVPGFPPVFMTSLNYPGLYGSYTYGILPGFQSVTPAMGGAYTSRGTYATGPTAVENTPAFTTNTAALIDVRVPADAELRFEGLRMNQPGAVRRFVSPPLQPGRTYSYQVSASWNDNGREVTQSRRVLVRAGDRLAVDFPTAAPAEPAANTTLRATTLP